MSLNKLRKKRIEKYRGFPFEAYSDIYLHPKKVIETLEQTRKANLERFEKYGPTFRGGKVFYQNSEEKKQE